jgi:tetratricopeptide (TPR) repeat protein
MNRKLIVAVLAMVAALCTTPAWAQLATVKGKVVGADGQPVVGANVEFVSTDTGRKYNFKTDGKGQYFSIGVASGTYNVTVTKDGTKIDSANGFRVTLQREENVLDFDLAKSQAAAEAKLSVEEKAKREAVSKENEKIKGLNNMLAAARAASQAGNYTEAVRIMTEATQADPTRDILWAQLGDAELNAGKHAPDRATATGNYQQAAVAFKKAIEIKPTVGAYYNNLGEAYAKLGQTKDAIEQYQLAATNDPPEAAKYYFNLGAVLTNTGHPDDANTAFDKALAANPNYAEAYYQKAVNLLSKAKVDEKTGTMLAPPEVATNLNKYLELSPEGPNAQGAKDLLASLGAKVETSYGTRKSTPKKK